MNTIHGAKAGAKAPKKTAGTKRGPGRPKGSAVGHRGGAGKRIGETSAPFTGESARLVHDMRAHHEALVAQRSAMDAQIECIGRAIEAMGTAAPARAAKRMVKRGRPAGKGMRAGSLKDFIMRVLRQQGKPMSPREIGTKVVSAGFKTKARDLTKAVSNTLPQVANVKKVGFGLYQIAGAAT
jgi:hypothetical protein